MFFVLFSPFVSQAQDAPVSNAQNFHQWGAITLFNGLPSDNVRAIVQTADGILWFGTDNGLARFDGRRVQTVSPGNTKNDKITSLSAASANEIWIGTDAGATRFVNGKFYPIPETDGKLITAILPGEITILLSSDAVFAAHHNPDGSLQIVTKINQPLEFTDAERAGENLLFSSRGRGLITEENGEPKELMSRPRLFFVNVLERDQSGDLWFGAKVGDEESGLFWAKDIYRPERVGENTGTVTAIAKADNGDFWVGTEKHGLFHFRGTRQLEHYTFENTSGGLRSNQIDALFVDRENVLWIGTNRGACRFDASSPFNQTLADNPNGSFVRTLYRVGDGRIFAGTNQGLFAFENGAWSQSEKFSAKAIYTIAENASGELLFGTPNGLFGFDEKPQLAGDVRALARFQNKTYIAVFGRGVLQIEGATQTPIFADASPTTIFADDKKLWIGTANSGVFAFDGKETKPENALDALRGAATRKIAKGDENDLWFANGRGLFLYKNNELQNVIANQDVRNVIVSGADVWAATLSGGLFHIKRDEIFGWLVSNLNIEQGLPSQQIFALLPIENRLLVGTNRGIVNYTPSATPPLVIPVRVLSQRLYDAKELNQTINLEYPQNSLLVEVAGLSSRTFPEQFQYAFLLKNSGGEILEKKLSGDAQFAPANLSAGEYEIEARVFNKDLLASEPLTIKFSVARSPFPWTATALGVLLAVALIALAFAAVERRQIVYRNRELAAARFGLANEAERERRRIARDLHDQTLADLRRLMMRSDELPTDNSVFRGEVESISNEIRRICEDLSPSVLENVGLTPALEFLLGSTIENHKFFAEENTEERINFTPNVQMQIYRIAQEVLNNIKRHSNADSVEMRISVSEAEGFILAIEDDGAAFNPKDKPPKGRGIANIKSRAALIEAEAIWQTSETGGTIFQLRK
ncbi:MAG: sensor histidine kinase [Pyrinomonadaceae bacterium]